MSNPFLQRTFLVSCPGRYESPGQIPCGLLLIQNGQPMVVDEYDCTGLCLRGESVFRVARDLHGIVEYRRDGAVAFTKLPSILDTHDLLVMDDQFVVVSTFTNEVVHLDSHLRVVGRTAMPGRGDAWHLNCLGLIDGKLACGAFGRFAEHREWKGATPGSGELFNIETGVTLIDQLNAPHQFRTIGDAILVCDSGSQNLILIHRDGRRECFNVDGYVRGVAIDEEVVFVGLSVNRGAATGSRMGRILALERTTLRELGQVSIPFPEIYDILDVSNFFDPIAFAESRLGIPYLFDLETGRGNSTAHHLAALERFRHEVEFSFPRYVFERVRRKVKRLFI